MSRPREPFRAAAAGCGGFVFDWGGRPRQCSVEPEWVGEIGYPTGRTWRAFACEAHRTHLDQPRPLSDEDRAELDGRRIQEAEALAGRRFIRPRPFEERP